MAFPVVETRASGRDAGNVTSHPITLPSGIEVGDLLLVVFSVDASETPTTTSEGWVRLAYQAYSTNVTGAIFYKIATGSDALSITTTTEEASHISFRISGAGTPTCSVATGSSTNSNPPNHTNPGGAEDVLWIVTRSGDAQVVATVAPASFSNLQTLAAATSGGASSNTAERLLNAASLDPGTFTSTTEQWVSFTVAIPPAIILTAIGDTVQLISNVRQAIPDTSQIVFHVRAAISDTMQSVWNVLTPVSDSIQAVWHVFDSIADTIQAKWHVRGIIAKTTQAIWHILTPISDTVQYIWHVKDAVADTVQAIWHTRTAVSDTVQYIWHVLTPVADTVQSIWNIRKAIADTIQAIWNVLAGVTSVWDTIMLMWNVKLQPPIVDIVAYGNEVSVVAYGDEVSIEAIDGD